MNNHNNFCKSLAKKGGTITLSSNDQPCIGAFSIGKEGSASGALWEHAPKTGSVLGASFVSGSNGVGGAPTQHRIQLKFLENVYDLELPNID